MALTITAKMMRSPDTRHTATAWPVPGEPTLWTVTWLPGRNLTRHQAETAMLIAEEAGRIPAEFDRAAGFFDDAWWSRMDGLAAELGMTGPNVLAWASLSPEDVAELDK